MMVSLCRCTCKNFNRSYRITRNNIFIVALELCKRFLKQRSPQCTVFALLGKNEITSVVKWHGIINHNCSWDTEDIELKPINTVIAELIIQEYPFKSTRFMSDS